jgi:hypothetical protein
MTPSTRNKPRRGLTVIAVLVCLVIITMVAGSVLKVALAHRDSTRAQERRLQAAWLAEAGLERALARLAGDPDYPGETWEISASDLDSADPGLVTIEAGRAPGDRRRREVRIQADYPRDPPHRARHSLQIVLELPIAPGRDTR